MTNDTDKIQEEDVSTLYQTLQDSGPSVATDEAILHFAKQRTLVKQVPVRKSRINWTGGFSVAASILMVSVLYWTQFAPNNVAPELSTPGSEIAALAEPETMPVSLSKMEAKRTIAARSQGIAMASDETLHRTVAQQPQSLEMEVEKISVTGSRIAQSNTTDEQLLGDVVVTDRPESAQASVAEARSSRFDAGKLKTNKFAENVSLSTKCPLSLTGNFRLTNTALAEYVSAWNDSEKLWLIEQLNGMQPFTSVVNSYRGEKPEVLNSKRMDAAYTQTLESMKRCVELEPSSDH